MTKKVFKYNMILYYQSLAVYFVTLVVYILLRLQFTDFDWNKIVHDSIFYLFILILLYVLASTIYYLIKRKEVVIENDKIILSTKFKRIEIPFENIESIEIKREHRFHLSGLLRTVKIKLKDGKKKSIVIRPFDYENDEELLSELLKIRQSLQKTNEVINA
jgi:predicted DNA-binding antitoxin AbrB/MazE fold protein